ncbi:hypothetical protein SARC_07981 [Sphaeroforma arctica JP610]|uniref:Chloride channel protein n=1 Tax=Sphaeroforma arctica JP610 TaxID=667725 RepID=A0A0L0FSB4_9EUKA|nr:hypothetical protein SARC_07981 [Sphaeroforma arctica JP610]KNC79630.1 hypothetical protein SARC_07981 [Sphaeroforma arctica JP610]|eukprot:XP_014153532.1 hypothetical protein SARC_07981 [Sphaeroforma arctica JP610]
MEKKSIDHFAQSRSDKILTTEHDGTGGSDNDRPIKSSTTLAHDEHDEGFNTNLHLNDTRTTPDSTDQKSSLPDPPPIVNVESFAQLYPPSIFWVDGAIVVVFSWAIALFGLLYMNLVMAFPQWWYKVDNNEEFAHNPHTMQFLTGRWWWIFVGALTGLVVSSLRVYMNITGPIPSFINEIHKQHQDPVMGMKVMVCACISLMGGAGLGPEAGLGAFGGSVGHLTSALVRRYTSWSGADLRRRLYTLCGMTAAFGSFLPAPFVSVALVSEIGKPCAEWDITYMRMFTFFTLAACSAYLVYSNTLDFTPLSQTSGLDVLPQYDRMPSNNLYDDQWYQIFVGMLFGLLGSAMALLFLIVSMIVKVSVSALRDFLSSKIGFNKAFVITAVCGGLFYGTCGYLMPLTIGDGIEQLHIVVTHGDEIGSAVCMETGFVGGLFLPIVAIGVYMARVVVNTTGVDFTLAIFCGFAMLPAALVPIPITMVVFVASTFALGAGATSPLLSCVITSYVMMMGIGIPQFLARKGYERRIASISRGNG